MFAVWRMLEELEETEQRSINKAYIKGRGTNIGKYYYKWKRHNIFKAKESSLFKKKYGSCFSRL